jgi:hypothetical protein
MNSVLRSFANEASSMGLLIREGIGWLLTVLGLALIGFVLNLALNRNVIEAMALSLPGVIVFRAGISLVKIASAGRIAAGLAREERPRADRRNS